MTEGKWSIHISKAETKCRCMACGFNDVDPLLIETLEAIRARFGKPIIITSCCRCEYWNRINHGKPGSLHLPNKSDGKCKAADIKIKGVPQAEVADFCEELIGDEGGVGRYPRGDTGGGWTHVDVRGSKARWVG